MPNSLYTWSHFILLQRYYTDVVVIIVFTPQVRECRPGELSHSHWGCTAINHTCLSRMQGCPPYSACPAPYCLWLLSSVQGRWRSWRPCGSRGSATTRRTRWWAASWTSTTWRACSTCWRPPWPSASSPSSGNTSSTGSCASASRACAPTGRDCSSPSAGSVPLAATSLCSRQVQKSTGLPETQGFLTPGWGVVSPHPPLTHQPFLDLSEGHHFLCS